MKAYTHRGLDHLRYDPDVMTRLLSKIRINQDTDCWEWTGSMRHQYGEFWVYGEREYAHRASFALFNDGISPALHVCHHCDNPRCINPDHLFTGTQADNNTDRHLKGRTRGTFQEQPIQHGTRFAVRAHRHRGETPCRPCLDAWNTYQRARRASRAKGKRK